MPLPGDPQFEAEKLRRDRLQQLKGLKRDVGTIASAIRIGIVKGDELRMLGYTVQTDPDTDLVDIITGKNPVNPDVAQLVSVAGLIGVGKTTVATKLAEHFGAPRTRHLA